MEDKLVIKLDWNKETTPPPSMADVNNFVTAFAILLEKQKFQTQVEVKEGSIDLVIQCVDLGITISRDIVAPLLISAISKPRDKTERAASQHVTYIQKNYNCTVNNQVVTGQPQSKTQKLSGVEYQVISHDLEEKTKTHFDRKNLPIPKSHSEKVEAFIEITSGELLGERFRIQTDPNFVERNKVYIASFELKGEKLKMTDKPMLLR